MSSRDLPFRDGDETLFVRAVTEHLQKGAATLRTITAAEYIDMARFRWEQCKPDHVYAIRLFVDPLTRRDFRSDLPDGFDAPDEPFSILVARIGSDGELVDAPAGYVPPNYPRTILSQLPFGSPSGGNVPDSTGSADYLFAFLDVLGFEELLKRLGLEGLVHRYEELLSAALAPQSEERPWAKAHAVVAGKLRPALMWIPIQTAYFSDSLLLWVAYHPGHVEEFLVRCSRVFCQALSLGLPLRGAISVGRAVLDKSRGIYLGLPLVEAVRLESKSEWIGVALSASWKSDTLRIPVPPEAIQIYDLPLKDGGHELTSGLVLDWPRVWRASLPGSAIAFLKALSRPELPDSIRARYDAAITFYDFSDRNSDWALPPGWTRVASAV
jgi:hypothetical protein